MASERSLVEVKKFYQCKVFKWTGLANTDYGEGLVIPQYPDRSIQALGTWGAGGAVTIEGSNDGTNYAVLHDPLGVDLVLTENQIVAVMEDTYLIRPRVTGGDGTTALSVYILVKGED